MSDTPGFKKHTTQRYSKLLLIWDDDKCTLSMMSIKDRNRGSGSNSRIQFGLDNAVLGYARFCTESDVKAPEKVHHQRMGPREVQV